MPRRGRGRRRRIFIFIFNDTSMIIAYAALPDRLYKNKLQNRNCTANSRLWSISEHLDRGRQTFGAEEENVEFRQLEEEAYSYSTIL